MKTFGIALGGGGIRGLAHVGVLKALIKHAIPIDYISGSSIGAWVGAHYARYQDIEKLTEFTVGKKQEKLLSFLEPSFSGGFIQGAKLERLLSVWLEDARFSDLHIPLGIVASDLIQREPYVFLTGRLVPAVHASMAIPGLFKPVVSSRRVLVDGDVCRPVPCDVVRSMGADIVLGVNLYYEQRAEASQRIQKNTSFIEVAVQAVDTMRFQLAQFSMKDADIVLQPDLSMFASWKNYFTQDIGAEAVSIGERETEKIIPRIRQMLGS